MSDAPGQPARADGARDAAAAAALPPALAGLPGARLVQGGSPRGGGNLLILAGEGADRALLKVYRRRRSALREALQGLSHRLFEGKRGVRAEERRATEREALALWAREGFAAPRLIERAPPRALDEPCLWMEWVEGAPLEAALRDATTAGTRAAAEGAEALLGLLGASFAARVRRAEALAEPLLLHEHGTIKHVLVAREPTGEPRLVTIDLEGGYRPGHPVEDAAIEELKGLLRSIAKSAADPDRAFAAVGAADRALFARLAERGARGGGLARRLKRVQDRWRRPVHGKTDVLLRLARLLSA